MNPHAEYKYHKRSYYKSAVLFCQKSHFPTPYWFDDVQSRHPRNAAGFSACKRIESPTDARNRLAHAKKQGYVRITLKKEICSPVAWCFLKHPTHTLGAITQTILRSKQYYPRCSARSLCYNFLLLINLTVFIANSCHFVSSLRHCL